MAPGRTLGNRTRRRIVCAAWGPRTGRPRSWSCEELMASWQDQRMREREGGGRRRPRGGRWRAERTAGWDSLGLSWARESEGARLGRGEERHPGRGLRKEATGQGEAPGAGGLVRVGAGGQGWKWAGTRGREAGDTSLPADAGRPHRAASGGEPECGGRAQGPDPTLQSPHAQTLLRASLRV